MTRHDPPTPQPTPWDLVGSFLSDCASVSTTIANRTMRLWEPPPAPASGGPATWWLDPEKVAAIHVANTQDICSLWLGVWGSERVAYPLPVACLDFEYIVETGRPSWSLAEQVAIPVAWAAVGPLPQSARIEISGGDPEGAAALKASLRARRNARRTGYQLESYDVRVLVPGAYDGMVYVDDPVNCPIAELRIVVGGHVGEPTVPTVLLRWHGAAPGMGKPGWRPDPPIVLRPAAGGPRPPLEVRIALAGGDDARALEAALSVVADPSGGPSYVLSAVEPPEHVAGFYTGTAYAPLPEPRALAMLEIVVERPPRTALDVTPE